MKKIKSIHCLYSTHTSRFFVGFNRQGYDFKIYHPSYASRDRLATVIQRGLDKGNWFVCPAAEGWSAYPKGGDV